MKWVNCGCVLLLFAASVFSDQSDCPPSKITNHGTCTQRNVPSDDQFGKRMATIETYKFVDGACHKKVWTGMTSCRMSKKVKSPESEMKSHSTKTGKPSKKKCNQRSTFAKKYCEGTKHIAMIIMHFNRELMDADKQSVKCQRLSKVVYEGHCPKKRKGKYGSVFPLKKDQHCDGPSFLKSSCNDKGFTYSYYYHYQKHKGKCYQKLKQVVKLMCKIEEKSAGEKKGKKNRFRDRKEKVVKFGRSESSTSTKIEEKKNSELNGQSKKIERRMKSNAGLFSMFGQGKNSLGMLKTKKQSMTRDSSAKNGEDDEEEEDGNTFLRNSVFRSKDITDVRVRNRLKKKKYKMLYVKSDPGCEKRMILKRETCFNAYQIVTALVYKRSKERGCQPRTVVIRVRCGFVHDNAASFVKSHKCPEKSESRGKCKDNKIQDVVTTYYTWDTLLDKCVRRLELATQPCDKVDFGKEGCPEPRIVEPGVCKLSQKLQKTLVQHYEPDGKGKCILRRDYIFPNCPKSPPKDDGCPPPQYLQKPCRVDKTRLIYKHYYVRRDGKCVKEITTQTEACAKFEKKTSCPPDDTLEKGSCEGGFRVNIVYRYERMEDGECRKVRKKVTETCTTRPITCPPKDKTMVGKCNKQGIQKYVEKYYTYNKKKGRCVSQLEFKARSCLVAKLKCPTPRILEPGPCEKGKRQILVEHYEYSKEKKKCVVFKDFVSKPCPKPNPPGHKLTKKEIIAQKTKELCPEPEYHQKACNEKGFRTVIKISHHYEDFKKGCVRHIKMDVEQCAKFVKTGCPPDETVESGPCRSGFRVDIVFSYVRDDDGKCSKVEKHNTKLCDKKTRHKCQHMSRKKVGDCDKEGLQRYLTTYYVFDKVKKKCVRKIKYKEKSCNRLGKQCPKTRTLEPGPCKNGKSEILVEHYEYDEDKRKCVLQKSKVSQLCGKKALSNLSKHEQEKKQLSKQCAEPKFKQEPCRTNGYRTVIKVYFEFEKSLDRCVKKIGTHEEQCAKLLKSSCPTDQTLEAGPCKNGFQENIVYKFRRNDSGVCSRKEVHVTNSCRSKNNKAKSSTPMEK